MLRDACLTSVLALVVIAGSERRGWSQKDPGAAPATDSPVVTKQELFAEPREMSEGTNVRLEDVVIRAKSGIVLRVADRKREIFVVPEDPSSLDFLAVGARVHVQGTLRAAPSARQAQLIYAMGPREARKLARSRFYVDAWVVSAVD